MQYTYDGTNVFVIYGDQAAIVVDSPTPEEVAEARDLLIVAAERERSVAGSWYEVV